MRASSPYFQWNRHRPEANLSALPVTAAGAAALPGGLDSVSATTLSVPAMCWISLVNSAMYASWRHCLAVHGSVDRRTAVVSGLWSVYSVNRLPSSMNRKMADGLEAGQQLSVES